MSVCLPSHLEHSEAHHYIAQEVPHCDLDDAFSEQRVEPAQNQD